MPALRMKKTKGSAMDCKRRFSSSSSKKTPQKKAKSGFSQISPP